MKQNIPPFVSTLLATVVCCMSTLHAQPSDLGYAPPENWEYIRTLDGFEKPLLQSSGDTLHIGSKSVYRLYSPDAGKNWHAIDLPSRPVGHGVTPYEALLWKIEQRDGKWMMAKSKDGGQNFDNDEIQGRFEDEAPVCCNDVMLVNPFDFNDVFQSKTLSEVVHTRQVYMRSTDGGALWKGMGVPSSIINEKPRDDKDITISRKTPEVDVEIRIVFDLAKEGRWYTESYDNGTFNYIVNSVTDDNGSTFEVIDSEYGVPFSRIGLFAGIEGPGVMRDLWRDGNRGAVIGVRAWHVDAPSAVTTRNWLAEVHPQKEAAKSLDGYTHEISEYRFLYNRPETAVIVVSEFQTIDDGFDYYNTWIYLTEDDGATWEQVWSVENLPAIETIAFDHASGSLWVITRDNAANNERYSLWRHNAFVTSVANASNPVTAIAPQLKIYPNPSNGTLQGDLFIPNPQNVVLELVGNIGAVVFAEDLGNRPAGWHTFSLQLPADVAMGMYWLGLRHDLGLVQTPALLLR